MAGAARLITADSCPKAGTETAHANRMAVLAPISTAWAATGALVTLAKLGGMPIVEAVRFAFGMGHAFLMIAMPVVAATPSARALQAFLSQRAES